MTVIMWICNAITTVIGYGILAIVAIGLFSLLWPFISHMVKFFAVAIPAVILYMLVRSGEWILIVQVLVGSVICVGGLWMVFRFFDDKFGILVSKDEAERNGW